MLLLSEMESKRIGVDAVACNAAITACGNGKRWDLALALCVLLGGFEGNSEASRGTVADLLFLVVSEQCVQLWDAARDSTG